MITNRRTVERPASLSEALGIDAQVTEWMWDALCAQTDPDAFHPEQADAVTSVAAAKAVCVVCPVLAECRSYALEHGERYGVWGGLSERERAALRRAENTRSVCVPIENEEHAA